MAAIIYLAFNSCKGLNSLLGGKGMPAQPVAAGAARAPLAAIPRAAAAKADGGFSFDQDAVHCAVALAHSAPAFATGATTTVNGLAQHGGAQAGKMAKL